MDSTEPSSDGAVELFAVPFASAMTDADLSALVLALDFDWRVAAAGASPQARIGPARLDHNSGLFLTAGESDGQWVLRARTWGHPGREVVHRWKVMSAGAARRLDPAVALPERLPDTSPEIPDLRVVASSRTRVAGFRRRLVGLS